jgi:taurine dioxygenase
MIACNGRSDVELELLPQGFGVEIDGFDAHDNRDPEAIGRLQQAYDEHGLLVFRSDRPIAPERQAEICSWFGPILPNEATGEDWGYLRNDQVAGSIPLPYHCDMSYLDHPILGISLHALVLPQVPTPTTFISNALIWERLSDELREAVQPLTLRHFFSGYRYDQWPDFEAEHPVCLRHPKTGRELLFVTAQHAARLIEVDEDRSAHLIRQLFDHIYRPEFEYAHDWQPHDLLVWDNLAMQHTRPRTTEPSEGSRVLQRVMLGRYSFTDQFDRAKQRHLAKGLELARVAPAST